MMNYKHYGNHKKVTIKAKSLSHQNGINYGHFQSVPKIRRYYYDDSDKC